MNKMTLITAGAGSGKTHRLAEEVYQAVASGRARPEAIILTTFTNKAAAELKSRVTSRLIAHGQHENARKLNGALIGTVHSVCAQLLKDFSLDLGIAVNQKHLAKEASNLAFKRAMSNGISEPLLIKLQKIEAVGNFGDWHKVVIDLAELARSNRLDAAALQRSAEHSLKTLFPECKEQKDGLAQFRITLEAQITQLESNRSNGTDTTDKTESALEKLIEARSELQKSELINWCLIDQLQSLEPGAKSRSIFEHIKRDCEDYFTWPEVRRDARCIIETIFKAVELALESYTAYKRQIGAIDYSDMESMLLDALDRTSVREALVSRIDVLFVDEFQDTNPIQLAIFSKIMDLAKAVIWVGDAKQSIYGFRGSDSELMNSAIGEWSHVAVQDRLEYSWRSRPELVTFVNQVFGKVFASIGQYPADVELKPQRPKELNSPALESWVFTPVINDKGKKSSKKTDNYAQLASAILQALNNNSDLIIDKRTKTKRPLAPGDIAILVRQNRVASEMASCFEEFGIPVEVAVPGLLEQPEIIWLLSAIHLLLSPTNALAAARLTWLADVCANNSLTPASWLNQRIAEYQNSDNPQSLPWANHQIIAKIRAAGVKAPSLSPENLVMTAIELSEAREFAKRAKVPRLALANLERIIHLARAYTAETSRFGRPVTAFGFLSYLDDLAEISEDKIQPVAANAVQILTYHAAKGLEWPFVVLYELGTSYDAKPQHVFATTADRIDMKNPLRDRGVVFWPRFYSGKNANTRQKSKYFRALSSTPLYRSNDDKQREESIRLLYVAMTRARDYLVFAAKPNDLEALKVLRDEHDQPTLTVPQNVSDSSSDWLIRQPAIDKSQAGYADSATRTWITYKEPVAKQIGRITPSQIKLDTGPALYQVGEPLQYCKRIKVKADSNYQKLGIALHAFFAVDSSALDANKKISIVKTLLQAHKVEGVIAPEDFVATTDAFFQWLAERWAQSTIRREVPLYGFHDGVIVEGAADLILETPKGIVLVDHKTFPGSLAQSKQQAERYVPQLMAYKQVIESALKRPVIEAAIHMPVSGSYFPIIGHSE